MKDVLKDLESELTHDCEEGEEAFTTENYSQQLCNLYELNLYGKWREEVVISPCHGSKISGSQQTVVLQIHVWQKKNEKKKKLTCMTFLSMTALRTKWWPIFFFLRTTMAVSVKKDC